MPEIPPSDPIEKTSETTPKETAELLKELAQFNEHGNRIGRLFAESLKAKFFARIAVATIALQLILCAMLFFSFFGIGTLPEYLMVAATSVGTLSSAYAWRFYNVLRNAPLELRSNAECVIVRLKRKSMELHLTKEEDRGALRLKPLLIGSLLSLGLATGVFVAFLANGVVLVSIEMFIWIAASLFGAQLAFSPPDKGSI